MKEFNPTKQQATNMAKIAGIELRPIQLNDYIYARKDRELFWQSDQELLDLTLEEEQKIKFRQTFDNIDF